MSSNTCEFFFLSNSRHEKHFISKRTACNEKLRRVPVSIVCETLKERYKRVCNEICKQRRTALNQTNYKTTGALILLVLVVDKATHAGVASRKLK